MNISFLGCPGSGKSTQARIISDKLGMARFSPGDIFRSEVMAKTPLGQEFYDYISTGRLVPDWLMLRLLKEKMVNEKRGIVFDGFPRTHEQVEALDAWLASRSGFLNGVIFMNMPDAEAAARVKGRSVCTRCGMTYDTGIDVSGQVFQCGTCSGALARREDDQPEILKKRIMVYGDQTEPLLSYYRGNGVLLDINAKQPKRDVTIQIAMALKSVV